MNEYEINILPINIMKKQVDVFFSMEEKGGYSRLYKKNLPKGFPVETESIQGNFVWWAVIEQEGDIPYSVNLLENKWFAKDYLNRILFDHFRNQNILTNRNFVSDTEVWLEDSSFSDRNFKKYNKFTLRIDSNYLIEGTSLLVSYNGDSFILGRSLETTPLTSDDLGTVIYRNRITKYKFLSEEEKIDRSNIFPKLNRNIKRILRLDVGRNFSDNKYKKYYELIHHFYEGYLKGVAIGEQIKIFESGFYRPYSEKIKQTTEELYCTHKTGH